MITWVRTASIHDGKVEDSFAWAVKVANYINEKFEATVRVGRNIGGPVYQIHWVSDYQSLAVYEDLTKKVEADAGYQELLAEARQGGLFIGTSIVDSLYEMIS